MTWLMIPLGYLLGSIPTAYIAGKIARGQDIREMGDGNMGAQNVFHQLGPAIGITVGLIDAGKGILAILLAQAAGITQTGVFLTGAATVIGHNWPIFLGFKGGRGESTTIGILYTLMPIPSIIVTIPGILVLLLTRNVIWSSAAAFVPLPFVCWWLHVPGAIIAYSLILLILVAITHVIRTRHIAIRRV
jgi:acyl phosphate:glycerol-3-phosphate acyltransferase